MTRNTKWQATFALVLVIGVPCRAGELGDYLTKEGQLKEAITVTIGFVGFLAPAPEAWIIKPSGEWVWEFTDSKGKFSSKQLACPSPNPSQSGVFLVG